MNASWLGLDIGTGGSRALLVDEQGRVRHAFTAPHQDIRMERPLWAEQSPENWWEAAQAAIRGVLRAAGQPGQRCGEQRQRGEFAAFQNGLPQAIGISWESTHRGLRRLSAGSALSQRIVDR